MWIIEIDENAHRSYDKKKDLDRTRAFSELFSNINFIRINPDRYYEPLFDKIMPSVCEKVTVYLSDAMSLDIDHYAYPFIREDELHRRLDVVIKLITDTMENNGIMIGEHLDDTGITVRKLFF